MALIGGVIYCFATVIKGGIDYVKFIQKIPTFAKFAKVFIVKK